MILFYTLHYPLREIRAALQQPQEQRYPVLQVHAGSFRVSVIHRTLKWTIGSLTCVRDYSYACTRTHTRRVHAHTGLGTPTASQHNILTRKNSYNLFLCSGRDLNLWSWSPLELETDALPIEPPRPPSVYSIKALLMRLAILYRAYMVLPLNHEYTKNIEK